MAQEADNQYEASDESSENELLDRSLSVWKGWNWNVKDVFDPVPLDLHTASSIGQYDVVRSYISRKVDLNKKNVGGWTPLMYACYIGHDNIVNLLLDAGVSVNVKNHKGQTPLMLASSCGNESVGYFLVQQGAELEARDHKGWNALFHATYAGHQNMVKFLLEQGANINAVEPSHGLTPFMEAAAEGHEIIVQLLLHHGVNVFTKAHNGDTARSLALIHSNMKIVSLIDNHVMPNTCLRSEAGLDAGELSSSDEAYSKPKQGHRGQKGKGRGPSIRDGPDAIARLINRSPTNENYKKTTKSPKVPKGYVTFPKGDMGADGKSKLNYRDVTSPINLQDYNALDSSGGRNTDSNDNEPGEDGNAFSKTGALTIKSSSGSSGGLMAAFGLSHSSNESDGYQPQDSISSSPDGSTGGRDLSENEGALSPASSYNKAMAQLSIKNQSGVSSESELENITTNEKNSKSNTKEHVYPNNPQPKSSAMSPTSQLKDREKQSNKSRSNSPSVKFNTQDVIMQQSVPVHTPPPQHQIDQHRPPPKQPPLPVTQVPSYPTTQIPQHFQGAKPKVPMPSFNNLAANFMPQLGCHLFPTPGIPDPQFFVQKKPDLEEHPRDLPSLLHQLGLTKYLKVFEEQDVDLQVFLSLTDNDLKEIGIKLFGPRKKMTNAIARWQSKAPMPTNDKLEQAYADRLEGEMQEMALQLIKATEQVDSMKAEVKQEQQLRLVTESCLNDERAIRHHMTGVMREMRMKCDEMKESLRNLTHNHSEIRLKLQNSGDSNALKDMSDNNRSITLTNDRLCNLEGVMKKTEQQIKDLQKYLSVVMINIDRIVRRTHNENGFS
ncbi:ankyrin repeat and SAM domain-containing protein 3-like [Saccostrea echinata]|uniref:ankyrin repeat and SAM domain-containing protein 3-like n=1 Tax=Saccostrea echinata TaxID=191078 RepID=UPI002A82A47C|nr:ankyrin repeat and SAM domain-containing protein 3-like [Saccostrea echinata]